MPPRVQIAFPGIRAAALSFIRGQAGNPTQAETTALLAAMTVQPNAARQTLINDTIFNLKNAGLWTTLDFLYVIAAHDAQAGRINWINPAQVMTEAGGALTFTADRGYQATGTAYLSTAVNWNTLTHYTQNDASIGVWVQNDAAIAAAAIGCLTTNNRISVSPKVVSGTALAIRINAATNSTITVTSSRGHSLGNRTGSAGFDAYKDAVLVGNTAAASVAVIAEEIVMFKNGASADVLHILSAAHGGSSLTPTQITNLNNIITAYMTGVGA